MLWRNGFRCGGWDNHGVDSAELQQVESELDSFVDQVFSSLIRKDRRAVAGLYLRGVMLDGRRKSMQPTAQRLRVDHPRLQQFVTTSPWDVVPVRRTLSRKACGLIGPDAWVVDDTGFAKDGTLRGAHRAERSEPPPYQIRRPMTQPRWGSAFSVCGLHPRAGPMCQAISRCLQHPQPALARCSAVRGRRAGWLRGRRSVRNAQRRLLSAGLDRIGACGSSAIRAPPAGRGSGPAGRRRRRRARYPRAG